MMNQLPDPAEAAHPRQGDDPAGATAMNEPRYVITPCPTCGAEPRQPCTDRQGQRIMGGAHVERVRSALHATKETAP